jgi:DNA invertase Pin-like site-specific DNA recombinase
MTGSRVALYARVSTTDKEQDPKTQLRHLRAIAAAHERIVVADYVDQASGRTIKGGRSISR